MNTLRKEIDNQLLDTKLNREINLLHKLEYYNHVLDKFVHINNADVNDLYELVYIYREINDGIDNVEYISSPNYDNLYIIRDNIKIMLESFTEKDLSNIDTRTIKHNKDDNEFTEISNHDSIFNTVIQTSLVRQSSIAVESLFISVRDEVKHLITSISVLLSVPALLVFKFPVSLIVIALIIITAYAIAQSRLSAHITENFLWSKYYNSRKLKDTWYMNDEFNSYIVHKRPDILSRVDKIRILSDIAISNLRRLKKFNYPEYTKFNKIHRKLLDASFEIKYKRLNLIDRINMAIDIEILLKEHTELFRLGGLH